MKLPETYWWEFARDGDTRGDFFNQSTRQDYLKSCATVQEAENFVAELTAGRIALNSDGSLKGK